jgi:hypothetical protein
MKPWRLAVEMPDKQQQRDFELDPNVDCATIVKQILDCFGAGLLGEDYGLFLCQQQGKILLEETKKLSFYSKLVLVNMKNPAETQVINYSLDFDI